MPISTLHKLDIVNLLGTLFSDCHSQGWMAGIESLVEHPAGFPYPMFRCNLEQKPKLESTTSAVGAFFGVCGFGGAFGEVDTYFKLANQTANFSRNSAVHERIVVPSCLVYPTKVNLPHNKAGSVDWAAVAQYDGTNDPFVFASGVTLPSNLQPGEFYGAGPASINGVVIPGVQEITIENEVKLIEAGSSSEEFNTFVGVETAVQKITIKTLQRTNWETLGLRGAILNGSSGLIAYARRFFNTGSRYANSATAHVAFQALYGTAYPLDSKGEKTTPITDTLVVECVSGTDSVVPVTVSTGVAIT